MCDAVRLPVVAAGGIGDGRGIAAAFALGADAVQIGTAYLRSNRSTAKQQDRFFAGVVVLQVVKGREGSFSVPGGQKR